MVHTLLHNLFLSTNHEILQETWVSLGHTNSSNQMALNINTKPYFKMSAFAYKSTSTTEFITLGFISVHIE